MQIHLAGALANRVTKWLVVVGWLVILVGAAVFAGKLSGVLDNQQSSYLPGSAESTIALQRLAKLQDPNAIPTVVAYERRVGLTPTDLRDMSADAERFAGLDGVTGRVLGPFPSTDGQAAQTIVTFNFGADGFAKIGTAADDIRAIAKHPGLTAYVTGPGGAFADSADAFGGLDTTLLYAALIVVIVILLITYRSPVLWLLPVISAVVALFTAQGVVYLFAAHTGLVVNSQSQGILTVLVFGAGTDYALLLVARYREELRRHDDRHEAMAFALHRASPAIVASAGTVVLGMLCLVFARMNSTSSLGPVLAIGVIAALVVMITLLPALLVIFGRWVFWPLKPGFGSEEPSTRGVWSRVGTGISRHPRRIWLVTAGILAVCCLGIVRLDTSGLSTEDSYTKVFDSIRGQQVLTAHGLLDASSPLQVVADASRAGEVRSALTGIPGLGKPAAPVVAGPVAYIAVPTAGDPSLPAALRAVDLARAKVHAVSGADALVGGQSAVLVDVERASAHDNVVIIPIILIVVLLVLMLLLRALVAPLVLIATVVLSFGAALGLSALLFEYVFGFAGSDASFPLFVFVFLVALGIDYNIFLMTRVREETREHGTRQGALIALRTTGGVITSAGIVLAATFVVLGVLPLVFLAELGTAVALGVVLDTFVVRSVLVTALAIDLDHRIWWPGRPDLPSQESGRVDPHPAGQARATG